MFKLWIRILRRDLPGSIRMACIMPTLWKLFRCRSRRGKRIINNGPGICRGFFYGGKTKWLFSSSWCYLLNRFWFFAPLQLFGTGSAIKYFKYTTTGLMWAGFLCLVAMPGFFVSKIGLSHLKPFTASLRGFSICRYKHITHHRKRACRPHAALAMWLRVTLNRQRDILPPKCRQNTRQHQKLTSDILQHQKRIPEPLGPRVFLRFLPHVYVRGSR